MITNNFFHFCSSNILTSLIVESKILENKKSIKNYPELLKIVKSNLSYIVKYQNEDLLLIYQIDDENLDSLDMAIIKAFLNCKYMNF